MILLSSTEAPGIGQINYTRKGLGMGKIRIGVVGLGRIGWSFHCHAIAKSRRYKLVAVSDPVADRLKQAEDELGCVGVKDTYELLAMSDLDAVTIASPTHFHKGHAVAAFKTGLHVMVEKPMAMDVTEARAILRAAKKSGKVLTIYQPQRAAAYFQHIKKILKSGRIGEVYHVRSGRFRYVQRDDWQSLRKFGAGMLNNYGAHSLDMVLHLTGSSVKKVFAQLRKVASVGDAEDVVKVAYQTRDGVIGEVDINQASAINPYEFQAWGTLGALNYQNGKIQVVRVKGGKLPKRKLNRSLASAGRRYPSGAPEFVEEEVAVNEHLKVDVYRNFANTIQKGGELLVKPEETIEVMKMIQRCRESSGRVFS